MIRSCFWFVHDAAPHTQQQRRTQQHRKQNKTETRTLYTHTQTHTRTPPTHTQTNKQPRTQPPTYTKRMPTRSHSFHWWYYSLYCHTNRETKEGHVPCFSEVVVVVVVVVDVVDTSSLGISSLQ